MNRITMAWQGSEQVLLSAPGMVDLMVAVPEPAELRTVTIWRDSLAVPDAGDAAAAWLTQLLGRLRHRNH